jgi:hypothetical protein
MMKLISAALAIFVFETHHSMAEDIPRKPSWYGFAPPTVSDTTFTQWDDMVRGPIFIGVVSRIDDSGILEITLDSESQDDRIVRIRLRNVDAEVFLLRLVLLARTLTCAAVGQELIDKNGIYYDGHCTLKLPGASYPRININTVFEQYLIKRP